jgi:hypothetical protein
LTTFKSAVELVKLFGFQEAKDEAKKEVIFKMNASVSASFLKVRFYHEFIRIGKKIRL